jgi:hypothetical protein
LKITTSEYAATERTDSSEYAGLYVWTSLPKSSRPILASTGPLAHTPSRCLAMSGYMAGRAKAFWASRMRQPASRLTPSRMRQLRSTASALTTWQGVRTVARTDAGM